MKTTAECMLCLLNRELEAVPATANAEQKSVFLREVLGVAANSDPTFCAAQVGRLMDEVYRRHFGARDTKDFATLKRWYNERLLAVEPQLEAQIDRCADPVACAILLARVGNYIDFGARHEVDESLFDQLVAQAEHETLDEVEYARLRADLQGAARVVYLTDNAGEIVLDKLLLRRWKALYPDVSFTALVRGAPTLNDATLEDAQSIGLTEVVPVLGNGSGLAGTLWAEISAEARALLSGADVIISKGQANFETLSGCGLNVYYLFLCKCDYFTRRFQVPRLTGMLVNERRLPPLEG